MVDTQHAVAARERCTIDAGVGSLRVARCLLQNLPVESLGIAADGQGAAVDLLIEVAGRLIDAQTAAVFLAAGLDTGLLFGGLEAASAGQQGSVSGTRA